MANLISKTILLSSVLTIAGCAVFGFKSTPWPNYTPTHDEKTIEFIRNVPAVQSGLLNKGVELKDYSNDDKQVLGISVSGGGMRAAAFTLGVLEELERQKVLKNVDFISSNSGGGWGVAAYIVDRLKYTDPEPYLLSNRRPDISRQFESMSEGTVKCLPLTIEKNLTSKDGSKLSYGDIFNSEKFNFPDHFVNAALLPSETSFTFTEENLRYFRVQKMSACDGKKYPDQEKLTVDGSNLSLANLSYGFAVATSGSVPLFYSSTAQTSICDAGSDMVDSSLCRHGKANDSELHIVDGGIHDNHAYRTAIELFSEYQNENTRCGDRGNIRCRLIIIDSTTNIISPLISKKENKARKLAVGFGTGSGFTGQDATAWRIRDETFNALGAETYLMDFFAAANLEDVDFLNLEADERFEGLTHLNEFITYKADCFANDGGLIENDFTGVKSKEAKERLVLRRQADDCLRNNAYRAGTIAKTTYDYDKEAGMFPVLWDLGIFVARQHEHGLSTAQFGAKQ